MSTLTSATSAKRQSNRPAMTATASTSSTAVGPMLKTTLRIRKSVAREPRSMIRDSEPICFDWWKSSDRLRACWNVSTAARAMVDCETRVNTMSRA